MEYARQDRAYAPAADRVTHFEEFVIPLSEGDLSIQGARCMDCGIPYCHTGCPVNNLMQIRSPVQVTQPCKNLIILCFAALF